MRKLFSRSRSNQSPSTNPNRTSRIIPQFQSQSQSSTNPRHELDGRETIPSGNFEHAKLFKRSGEDRMAMEDYAGAITMFGEALRFNPADYESVVNRAVAYLFLGSLDYALTDVNTALQHNPTAWYPWKTKGDILCAKGEFNSAEEAYQNALGFAQGMDKMTVQRSLTDVRIRLNTQVRHTQAHELPISVGGTPSSPAALGAAPVASTTPMIPSIPPFLSTSLSPTTSATAAPAVPTTPAMSASIQSLTSPTISNSMTSTRRQPISPLSSNASPSMSQQPSVTAPSQPPIQVSNTPTSTARSGISTNATTSTAQDNTTTNTSTATAQGGISTNISPPIQERQPTTTTSTSTTQPRVQRQLNSTTINSTNANTTTRSVPFSAGDIFDDVPTEPPPSYSVGSNPSATNFTLAQLETRLSAVETTLATKNRGKAAIRAYTDAAKVDMVQLVYLGLTQAQLTARELGTATYLHPSHNKMAVDGINYPGSKFLDMDCESGGFYEGKIPGTVSVSGYSEEYRIFQLSTVPLLSLTFESNEGLPVIDLDKIVARLQRLQLYQFTEESEGLKEFLGLSSVNQLTFGFGPDCNSATNRQKRIDNLCMMISRSSFLEPTRFIDFSKTRTFTNRLLSQRSSGSDIMLRDFLYQILLGAELLTRLRLQPAGTSYSSIISERISAMTVLADLFMQNVQITNRHSTTSLLLAAPTTGPKYSFYANCHQRQVEGLLRFAEAMAWPLLDEARATIESSYAGLASGTGDMSWDVCDWLFGLVFPGQVFRHRIMAVLVDVSPTVRHLNAAPYFDNGLIVKNKSYWPKRTVLGRVLGGLRNPRSVCGWVGPVPAPKLLPSGDITGWVRLNARELDIPTPIVKSQRPLETFGFISGSTETREQMIDSIVDINEYINPTNPAPIQVVQRSQFKSISLELMPEARYALNNPNPGLPKETYRASLEFEVNGKPVKYTLFSNPVFVNAPPCIGTHPMFRRQAQMYLREAVSVVDLKETHPEKDKLLIINALGEGDEVVARAWCAETGRHAVVRRDIPGQECCFTCAVELASTETGLGVNCIIWSR